MPSFSSTSRSKLETCDDELQEIFNEVILSWDCTILTGHRDQWAQDEAYRTGKSKVQWPDSKHNSYPSRAVDVAPYPIDWEDRERFYFFAGFVLGIAQSKGIKLRFGGDWDGDKDIKDQSFFDLPHFELA